MWYSRNRREENSGHRHHTKRFNMVWDYFAASTIKIQTLDVDISMVKVHSEGWRQGLLTEGRRKRGDAVLLDKEKGGWGRQGPVSDIQLSLRFPFCITSNEPLLQVVQDSNGNGYWKSVLYCRLRLWILPMLCHLHIILNSWLTITLA
jgi:hypothetical protein